MRLTATALSASCLTGLAAFAVKRGIAGISHMATVGFRADSSNIWLLLLGIISITLSGIIVRKIVKTPIEHATARIKRDLASNATPPKKMIIAPIAINAVTLGLGGSAGAEGPIAYSGGSLAVWLSRRFGLPGNISEIFLACGAGAGIAAIFQAPIGGVMFTLEVLRYTLAPRFLLMLVAMCLISSLTAFAANGFVSDFAFTPTPFDYTSVPMMALLGVACGLYSIYYNASGKYAATRLAKVSSPLVRNLIAGTVLGICLFLFPILYGEGYAALAKVVSGQLQIVADGACTYNLPGHIEILVALAGVLLLKGIASYSTNSGGGVAGEFAPTIFAGGILGVLFSLWSGLPVGNCAVTAMAGVMAGCINAPLMAIFIVIEMTSAYTLLLPVSLVSGISYLTTRVIKFSKTKHQ